MHSKDQNPLHQFSRNKLARAKVRCVALFPKFHYNDLLSTCCGLVGRVAKKSIVTCWQIPRLRGSFEETCVLDFGHNVSRCPHKMLFATPRKFPCPFPSVACYVPGAEKERRYTIFA